MNALANSQELELEKFLRFGYGEGHEPVTFKRYTGQEKPDTRRAILANPPDILLTNYVMLDLVLTRPDERQHLISAAAGLDFLVLDELHTYRGRQGADVALLVRRVRDACEAPELQASAPRRPWRRVAPRRSGPRRSPGSPPASSGRRSTPHRSSVRPLAATTVDSLRSTRDALGEAVRRAAAEERLRRLRQPSQKDPLARWVESTFGLDHGTRAPARSCAGPRRPFRRSGSARRT